MSGAKRQKRYRERQREKKMVENPIVGSERPVKLVMTNTERQLQRRLRQRELKDLLPGMGDAGQQGLRCQGSIHGERGISFRQLFMDGMTLPSMRRVLTPVTGQ